MLKKILLISFLFIPVGIITGYFIDRFQYKQMQRQSEETLNQLKQSMEDLENLESQFDSLQGQEFFIDTLTGNSNE